MGLGRQADVQSDLLLSWSELPRSQGQPFRPAVLARSMHQWSLRAPARRVSGLGSGFCEIGDDGDCRTLSLRRGLGLDLGLEGSGGLGLLSGMSSDGGHARQAFQQ